MMLTIEKTTTLSNLFTSDLLLNSLKYESAPRTTDRKLSDANSTACACQSLAARDPGAPVIPNIAHLTMLQKHLAPSFSSSCFAYRPFLGPRRAGAHVAQLLPRFSHAVTADIEKFFDNVEHGIVVQQLQ